MVPAVPVVPVMPVPLRIVSPLIVTVTPLFTVKTVVAWFPSTASRFAPGPVIVMLADSGNVPCVSVIAAPVTVLAKVIVLWLPAPGALEIGGVDRLARRATAHRAVRIVDIVEGGGVTT